jgi:hypothetical protein
MSLSSLWGPFLVFIKRDYSGHLQILRDFSPIKAFYDAVEKELLFNINWIIEKFLELSGPIWVLIFLKFKIFTKILFNNILGEVFVGILVKVGP